MNPLPSHAFPALGVSMNERRYESSDLSRVVETYTASIHSLAAPYYSAEQLAAWAPIPPDEARWRERLATLHTIVTEADGLVAGFASYNHDGYLDFLFTHPAFARRGIASRLYHRVESALLAVGARTVTTHASLAARAFFDHLGFQLDAEECVECRGSHLRRFAMHKSLIHDNSVQTTNEYQRGIAATKEGEPRMDTNEHEFEEGD